MNDEIHIDGDKIDVKELMIEGTYINKLYADTFILNQSGETDETDTTEQGDAE